MNDTRLFGHLQRCLGAGDVERARTLLHRHIDRFELPPGNPQSMRAHGASVRLARLLTEAGEGDDTWLWPDPDPDGGGPIEWSYRTFDDEVGRDARKRLVRMDLCLGTDRLKAEFGSIVDGRW